LGLPAVLVPLPGAGGDEQTANARLVEKAGGAVVLPQPELSPEGLVDLLTRLLTRRTELAAMGTRARTLAAPDAAERPAGLIREVAAPGDQRQAGSPRRRGERQCLLATATRANRLLALSRQVPTGRMSLPIASGDRAARRRGSSRRIERRLAMARAEPGQAVCWVSAAPTAIWKALRAGHQPCGP